MKVLVTGGGGFLGNAIVKRLVQRGEVVYSLSRNFYPELEKMDVEQLLGDIADREVVENACKQAELVFHTAAKPPPWGSYSAYYQTNVTGTQNVIDACIRHKVSRLVYTSTPSVVFNGDDLAGVDESCPYPSKYKAAYPKTKALA